MNGKKWANHVHDDCVALLKYLRADLLLHSLLLRIAPALTTTLLGHLVHA